MYIILAGWKSTWIYAYNQLICTKFNAKLLLKLNKNALWCFFLVIVLIKLLLLHLEKLIKLYMYLLSEFRKILYEKLAY